LTACNYEQRVSLMLIHTRASETAPSLLRMAGHEGAP